MLKKSQGLSLNTIIIAAIVLIVLIVLWAIFTGRFSLFSSELQECRGTCTSSCAYPDVEDPNGYCNPAASTATGGRLFGSFPQVCCVKLS
ncbi:MAG TPA: hypothetical protein VJH97_05150 [Candidatus Nanoarchaeia archaeon]|nr:hypothetical protein [Candidatus Nanoarchaeia archaeon]